MSLPVRISFAAAMLVLMTVELMSGPVGRTFSFIAVEGTPVLYVGHSCAYHSPTVPWGSSAGFGIRAEVFSFPE